MSARLNDAAGMAAARNRFLRNGSAPADAVPPTVLASWRRSASAGVDAVTYQVPFHDDVEYDSRLSACARPVLQRLAQEMHDIPVTIALADARARIVERLDCSSAVGRVLDTVDFNPGFGFEEMGVGTNGIGTVFESGRPVSVVGPAHFTQSLLPFACTGAPVKDPISGRVAGVLDVSQVAETWNPLVLPMVTRAAGEIADLLLADRTRATRALFEAFDRADGRTQQGVIAVGSTVMLNQRVQRMLTPQEQAAVVDHARGMAEGRARREDRLLMTDATTVRLRVMPVTDPPGAGFIVVVERSHDPAAPPVETHSSPGPTQDRATASSPAWTRAVHEIGSCAQAGQAVLVAGEAGSGRTHAVREALRSLAPDPIVVSLDHAQWLALGSDDGSRARGVLSRHAVRADALVVQDLSAFARAEMLALRDAIEVAEHPPLLAAVVHTSPTSIGTEDATAAFDRHVPVPPLRHRTADLGGIAADLLVEIAPQHRLRLSSQALSTLRAYQWPGNLPQLRAAVEHAARKRVTGEITVQDLPLYCLTDGTVTLTTMQGSERDTIVAALRECDGNRVHAAKSLGISRSSLYRKIASLRITEI